MFVASLDYSCAVPVFGRYVVVYKKWEATYTNYLPVKITSIQVFTKRKPLMFILIIQINYYSDR